MRLLKYLLLLLMPLNAIAQEKIVNVYAWANDVPTSLVQQFEKETGIKVNFSTYSNNEIMFTKLRASQSAGYDIVMPSSYFVDRMQRQGMLATLDKSKLPNVKNLDAAFLTPAYDPTLNVSIPFVWGITGIFVNRQYHDAAKIKKWSDLWDQRYHNQLMLLDDIREVFSMALLALHYSANDQNPAHIKAAFLKLKTLMPNVKVFSSETIISDIIDDDATLGMAWNGDTFKAARENASIDFVFPEDGFVIWVDNFSIPKNAQHKEEAYQFINFMLRPDIAKETALLLDNSITNAAGRQLLPESIRHNPTIYPSKEVMRRGQFQTDVSEDTLTLLEQYWEELKIGG
ncbi:MAG: spermidine/putrescine ABC transporter substrate-binding protein [Gammaproteobacteria bacterium RIFCSPHIGHO2_12_FULL_43_28]|nr:MAG: spermidine/putrescine ABC transporter substrate-binding protein [Gammaproteobacteria bacterium RIFCSPHIGHO2_12_FULL_43_28]